MLEEAKLKQTSDTKWQQNQTERAKLPAFSFKAQLMEAINDNPVIIVRGNTGCGRFQIIPWKDGFSCIILKIISKTKKKSIYTAE